MNVQVTTTIVTSTTKKGCAILKHFFHLWIKGCLNYLSGFSFRVLTMYDKLICGSWFC